MKTFPIMLNMTGRLAVVVGAGEVGMRKVRALLAAGAEVRLIDPVADKVDSGSLPADRLERIAKQYDPQWMEGATLVFACTDDRATNARIAADARTRNLPVNAADQPEDCDFYMPALCEQGDVVIAIGTGGACPAVAASLRNTVVAAIPPRIGDFVAALAAMREGLKEALPDSADRGRLIKELVQCGGYKIFLSGGDDALRRKLQEIRFREKPGGPAKVKK